MVRLPKQQTYGKTCVKGLLLSAFAGLYLSVFSVHSLQAWTYENINGVRVIQNQVFDNESVFIDGSSWNGAIVRNNTFKNHSDIALRIKNANNVIVENNEFYGQKFFAILLPSTQTSGTDNIIIQNNNFHDMSYTAIHTKDPNTRTKILNNTFTNVTVPSTGNKLHAIYVKGPDFLIEGNTITNVPDGHAISVRTSGVVKGNIAKGAFEYGIKYYSDGIKGSGLLVIENNICINNGLGAMRMDQSSSGVELDKVIIRFNTSINNGLGLRIDNEFVSLEVEVYANIFIESNLNYFDFNMQPTIDVANLTSNGDIGFINFNNEDFQLQQSSVAIETVVGIPAIPPYDLLGNSMDVSPYDAGAYQYISPDTDGDGLTDSDEQNVYFTDPNNPDSDSDGLNDGLEVLTYSTDPNDSDTDNDTLTDGAEINTYGTNPNSNDTDADGILDGVEVNTYQSDPTKTDTDSDGLMDGDEVNIYGTDPINPDTDSDGLTDYNEIQVTLTNPLLADTDGDGYDDQDEIFYGTDPNDNQSYGYPKYEENFNQGSLIEDLANNWVNSGQTSNVTWSLNNQALRATVMGNDIGYSYSAPNGKDFSTLNEMAILYDVTFEANAKWGGLWIFGVYVDINVNRCGIRDDNPFYVKSTIKKNKKHQVLVLLRKMNPYYQLDIIIDGKEILMNEPIEKNELANSTIGFVSPYYKGNMNIDNFVIWPLPVPTPLNEDFSGENLAIWKLNGNENIDWGLDVGGLKSKVKSNGYGFAKHALLDVSGKDIVTKFKFGYHKEAKWGGFLYRGVYLDLNPLRIGWRDDNYTYLSSTFASDTQHEAVLIIRQNPSLNSTLYVDGTLIFLNEPIEKSSFTDNTVGFVSNYYGGEVIIDDFYIEVVNTGNNLALVFMDLKNQSVLGGESLSYQINTLDAEGLPLTFSSPDIGALPGGANLTTDGLLTWSPVIEDAGSYSVTVEATDGVETIIEVIQIAVNTPGVDEKVYSENFDAGLDPGDDWQENDPSGNVNWTVSNGTPVAVVTGSAGYSYYAPMGKDFSIYGDLVIEYDVEFKGGARWGGLWFCGIYLDVNRDRFGWRDDHYTFVKSNLSADAKHHIIVFIKNVNGTYESDLYVDGVPIFLNEPIESSIFTNDTIGFVSPYYSGQVILDNLNVYDFGSLSASPIISFYYNDDFSSSNIDSWISSGATSNTDWEVQNNNLFVSKTSQGGYSYIWPFAVDVRDKEIKIDFDITYKEGAVWGGLYYRGVYLDLNPTRVGWRDDSYVYISSPIVEGKTSHVQVIIRQDLTSDVYVDGVQYIFNELIDSSTFSNNSVGFVSNYFNGSVIFDNLVIDEI